MKLIMRFVPWLTRSSVGQLPPPPPPPPTQPDNPLFPGYTEDELAIALLVRLTRQAGNITGSMILRSAIVYLQDRSQRVHGFRSVSEWWLQDSIEAILIRKK